MLGKHTAGEMPALTWRNGVPGYRFGGLFIPRMAGGETPPNPGEGDPPKGDGGGTGKDGTPFDADRAQRTIDQLREEIKGLKGTSKEAETLRARLKEIEDKDKSEVERLAGTAREAGEKLTAASARAQDLAIRLSVERAARKLNFIDEDDAYRLIDRKSVVLDDDGEPTNVEKLLTDLAKAKPHLVKATEDGSGKKADRGTPPMPKPQNGKAPSRDELIAEKKKQLEESGSYARLG